MKKKIIRITSFALCIVLLFSFALSASALTISTQTKATKCGIVTCGDKLLGKKTPITIKNTSDYPIKVTFIEIDDCKVTRSTGAGFTAWSSMTIYGGNSATFNIKTGFGHSGVVRVKVESTHAVPYSYTITGKNYEMIARVG